MQPLDAYQELVRQAREESLLSSCAALLDWDELTCMPEAAVESRGEQRSCLAGILHEKAIHPRRGELLANIEDSTLMRDPDAPLAVNVREWRRVWDRLVRIPRTLVEELTLATSRGQHQWAVARAKRNYALFRPALEQIVALKRAEAECVNPSCEAYDALLDEYEPGSRSQDVARMFDDLRQEMLPLLDKLLGAKRRPEPNLCERVFPVEEQRKFGIGVARTIGFDFRRGRLDTAMHPFTLAIGRNDCRITTRFTPDNFSDGFFTILHEAGHGLYEQGLDPEHHGTPMGEAVSVGVHESQSRLWENLVGKSRGFWRFFFADACKTFPQALGDIPLDEFYFSINVVQPSLSRVQADELTYNLHILIRFELERALLKGDLKVGDVPAAWKEAYQHYLGIVPENDAEGCLQDGHWSEGLIGYFPTYTLGNLFAAQLFTRASADLGALDNQFSCGEFTNLLAWLRQKVHRHGGRFPAGRLIERATGAPVGTRPLVQLWQKKFGDLYGI